MHIHPAKCCVLHLGRKNPKTQYWLDGIPITPTDTVKDLGVVVDDNLKWSPQCLRVSKRAHRILTLLYKTFLSREPDVLLRIYKSHVRPLLEYVSPVWSPYLRRDIDIIEKVQVRFTRFFLIFVNCHIVIVYLYLAFSRSRLVDFSMISLLFIKWFII